MINLADSVEIAALLLVAYVGGCGIGYGLRRLLVSLRKHRQHKAASQILPSTAAPRPRPSPAARLAMTVTPEEVAPAMARPSAPDSRPQSLPSPRGGTGDDLRQIKGVGPKIEATLHEIGVFHYDQIAAWTEANAEWIDLKLGFRGRVTRERWIAQAATLANPASGTPRKVA